MPGLMGQLRTYYSKTFLIVMFGLFFVSGIFIFLLPRTYFVVSALEVGLVLVGDRQEPIEPPEQVAKQITSFYLRPALIEISKKGVSQVVLDALVNLKAEAVGRAVIMQGDGDTKLEDSSKVLQQMIIDLLIRDRLASTQIVRDASKFKVESAKRLSAQLETQASMLEREIDTSELRVAEITRQIDIFQVQLAEKFRSLPTSQTPISVVLESEIREIRDQISTSQSLRKDIASQRSQSIRDLAELRSRIQEQLKLVDTGQREQRSTSDMHMLVLPTAFPSPIGPRRISLLLAALALSGLVAFGTAALLHKLSE